MHAQPGKGDGIYRPMLPLDELILRELPKQGALIAGIYPDGKTAKEVSKVIKGTDAQMVSTRLRVLGHFGLTTGVQVPRQSANGWQITPVGEKFLNSGIAPNLRAPTEEAEIGDVG